jgi:hypothetical protein
MVNVSEKCCKFSISISPTARGKYQFIFLSLECRHCVVHMLLEGALQDGGIDGAVTQQDFAERFMGAGCAQTDLFDQSAFELIRGNVPLGDQILSQCARHSAVHRTEAALQGQCARQRFRRYPATPHQQVAQEQRASKAAETILLFQHNFQIGVADGTQRAQNGADRLRSVLVAKDARLVTFQRTAGFCFAQFFRCVCVFWMQHDIMFEAGDLQVLVIGVDGARTFQTVQALPRFMHQMRYRDPCVSAAMTFGEMIAQPDEVMPMPLNEWAWAGTGLVHCDVVVPA